MCIYIFVYICTRLYKRSYIGSGSRGLALLSSPTPFLNVLLDAFARRHVSTSWRCASVRTGKFTAPEMWSSAYSDGVRTSMTTEYPPTCAPCRQSFVCTGTLRWRVLGGACWLGSPQLACRWLGVTLQLDASLSPPVGVSCSPVTGEPPRRESRGQTRRTACWQTPDARVSFTPSVQRPRTNRHDAVLEPTCTLHRVHRCAMYMYCDCLAGVCQFCLRKGA